MFNIINKSIRNKIIFWMLISLSISSLTILYTTSQKIREDHIELTKQQLELFSTNIFNELRVKMNEGDNSKLQVVIDKAKTLRNVADLRILRNQKLIDFHNSSEEFTKEKNILEVFYSKEAKILAEKVNGDEYLKLISPIIATDECLKCHTNQKNGEVMAAMEAVFLLNSYNEHSEAIIKNIIYASLFFGLLTIIVLLIIIRQATEPIAGLKYGFKRLLLSDGGNAVKLKIRTEDEIGEVADLFNQYTNKLNLEFKKNTEKFAQSIMDTQSDIVVTLDENRMITTVNKAFLDFFDVMSINDFITHYGEDLGKTFQSCDNSEFISEYIDGIYWEVYVKNYKNKIHKVILENKKTSAVFTVSTNSVAFDEKIYTTSVFTNIDELETIREKMEENHTKLKNLFNNANEGFLYFNKDMLIGDEYSQQAKEIFGFPLEDEYITDLLFIDKEEAKFVQDTLVSLLDDTFERQEVLLSLLKDEFTINGKFIKVQYKVIGKDIFMLILSDITQNKYLNEKIKDEQQVYKMVINVITFEEQFIEVKNEYDFFITTIKEYKTLEKLPELRRKIHTFKGLFAQLELLHIVKRLHSLENQIDYSLKLKEVTDDLLDLSILEMQLWLEKDLEIIHKILKRDILAQTNGLKIETSRIENIYKNLDKYESQEQLKEAIKELTYHNIKDTFYVYEQLIRTLSVRFDKPMNEMILKCEDIYLGDKYKPFLNSFVHIFRNSLDHGIESQEERYALNKDLRGTIECNIHILENNLLQIIYKDDGKGIDVEKIKTKAKEKNIVSALELDMMSENEILMLIFKDSMSTKEIITDISGRGVGLSSLKVELEKLGGTIQISNYPEYGVEFKFIIPM